ncbi:nickel pincer cofactor biosynthesis protein LarB [uncultured Selenomonas sp.]|uniref:nickel pincer cofactor biosynthesis protein LarB n=1 Tax=uncultured Selenomonas sp. TaxID=159275 RepID=UPI00262C3E2A|nr:nickel pincer cofactor biosynthesis protein LarB [uncultured Selenomonas sp.]
MRELSAQEGAWDEVRLVEQKELGFAAVDTGREKRQGFAEVVYGAGKTAEQIAEILKTLLAESEGNVMATRVDREKARTALAALPEAQYDEVSRIVYVERRVRCEDAAHRILVVTAGTSDIPVAEEAALTARLMGNDVRTIYDVGVAGIHRLLAHREELMAANVVIVVAGMEGALASVVGGLVARPVIAVPTSVGYGASFHGLTALLSMLNSCAAGVAVVNIDNGFGAGAMASRINQTR